MLIIKPVMLEGNYVLLRPPLITDVSGLSLAAKDGEIWNNPYAFFPHEDDISLFLQDLLKGSKSFYHPGIYEERISYILFQLGINFFSAMWQDPIFAHTSTPHSTVQVPTLRFVM